MRVAIVSMQTLTARGDDPYAARDLEALEEESRHALAIATALNGSDYSPWLICSADSPLAYAPVPVPRLCIQSRGASAWFKLWQWQRRQEHMVVLAVGEASLKHGLRLLNFGKKGSRLLVAAFFILPPTKESCGLLEHTKLCLCGSDFIGKRIGEYMQGVKAMPRLLQSPPGLDLDSYPNAPVTWKEGQRFVFGMAGSLLPQSGALLVVRAMAALWQNDSLPPWEVRMFGGGPRFAEIMDEAASLGVKSRLAILDEQPLGEVSRHCHVWLAPGIAPDELPPVLWAGFGSGLPVICAKSWLHKERVYDQGAVMTTGPENPQELARAMLGLMQDGPLRELKGKAAWDLRPSISLPAMARRVCERIIDSDGVAGAGK